MAGGDRQPGGSALERSHTFLQHRIGRITDARVDVAEGLEAEQRGSMIDVLEYERGRLVDRRRACAGGRVRLRPGMDRKRCKAWVCSGMAGPRLAGPCGPL